MSEFVRFCLTETDRFVWRHWDGELVFFDDHSGETRLLFGWSGAVLELIADKQPIDTETIHAEMLLAVEPVDSGGLQERVDEAISMLRDNGLIANCPKC